MNYEKRDKKKKDIFFIHVCTINFTFILLPPLFTLTIADNGWVTMPRVFIKASPEDVYRDATRLLVQRIRDFVPSETRKTFNILVSPNAMIHPLLDRLVRHHRDHMVSFQNVTFFASHEYCGLPKSHPQSVHAILWRALLKHIDVKPQNVIILDGNADNLDQECSLFEQQIANTGGLDFSVCSPGCDGHVGFNMPGSSLASVTRVKTLSSSTRKTHAIIGPDETWEVPRIGLTVGVQTVLSARELLTIAVGVGMGDAVVALTNAEISHSNSLTYFQNHPAATVVSDEDACEGMLRSTYTYYKDLEQNALHNDLTPAAFTPLDIKIPISQGSGVMKVVNIKLLRGTTFVEDDLWIREGRVIDPSARFWEAHEEEEYAAETIVNGHGAFCCAGLVDIQINGAFGVDFTDPSLTPSGVRKVSQGILSHGCTSYCPTVITSGPELYRKNLGILLPKKGGENGCAHMLGCHLEGPFLSKLKNGAHDRELIIPPKRGFQDAVAMYGRMEAVALVTIAPEVEGALATIEGLTQRGVKVSVGHSNATLCEAEAGVAHGASLVTHLYNAMRSFSHRDPGLIGILGSDIPNKPYFGIIVDGLHTHPASVRIAYEAHPNGCILVTDAMEAMGMPPGSYKLAGKEVTVVETRVPERYGGHLVYKATLEGQDTLAGAVPTLIECVKNLVRFTGCSIAEAMVCASLHPAKALGIERRYVNKQNKPK